MNIKEKILKSLNELSEKEMEEKLLQSGEGICIQLDDDNCVIMSGERFIE